MRCEGSGTLLDSARCIPQLSVQSSNQPQLFTDNANLGRNL